MVAVSGRYFGLSPVLPSFRGTGWGAGAAAVVSITALTGGRFSLVGSVIGALIIQTLTYAIYSLGVPPEINLVVKAIVVFVVMLLQSAEFRAQVGVWIHRPAHGEVRS